MLISCERMECSWKTLGQGFSQLSRTQVLPKGEIPHTRHVRGSNFVLMGVFEDRLPGRAIVICVIDNLVKVAASPGLLLSSMAGIIVCHLQLDMGMSFSPTLH